MLIYKDVGKGRSVILVHGNLASHRWWQEIQSFPPRNTRLIAPDMYGFGQSKVKEPYFKPSIEEYAESLIDFLRNINVKKTSVVGHSLGGAVVMEMLAKRPDLFESVMLLSSSPVDGLKVSPYAYPFLSSVKYNRRLIKYLLKQAMPRFTPDNFEDLVDDAQSMYHRSFVGNVKALENWRIPEEAKKYEGNVYVVRGEYDDLITNDMNVETATQFSNNRIFLIKDSGHSPQIENSIAFREILVKMLEE